jgi:hypothetical protein
MTKEEFLVKRLINQEKWLELLHDHRGEEGVAKHFSMTLEQLHIALEYWGIK